MESSCQFFKTDLRGMLQKEAWQGRIVYNQSQKEILQKWFQHNPYPDKPTREQMAKEIGIPEPKIQIWFKNQRSKLRQLGSEYSLGKDQIQEQDQAQLWIKEYLKEVKCNQPFGRRSQSNMLVRDFERSQSSDVAARKKMVKQASIPESRIQNARSLYLGQSRNESMNSMIEDPNGRSDLTIQQNQAGISTLPGRSHHFSSSSSVCQNQSLLLDHLPSNVSSVPCVIQRPSVIMLHPTKAMKENENSPSPLTLEKCMPRSPTLGEKLSDTQTDFYPTSQEKCENHKQQTMVRKLQLKDYSHSQSLPEHKKHQSQDLDISYIMQWWDEGCQALIAEWDPQEGTS